MKPLVSVLMTVHNEPKHYLEKAIRSICEQTYDNIEFLIIDDESNQTTFNLLKELSNKYPIIKLVRNEINLGLTASLNKGLNLVNGEFIARMDADDFSMPKRIAKQVDYLLSHNDIDIIGTGVVSFGDKIMYMSPFKGASYKEIQSYLFFSSGLCHPSVMFRKKFLDKFNLKYNEQFKKSQDFELWERASMLGKLAVLPEVLLYYRIHRHQISVTNHSDQLSYARTIRIRRITRFIKNPTSEEIQCHEALLGFNTNCSLSEIKEWIISLLNATQSNVNVDSDSLEKNLKIRLLMYKLKIIKSFSFDELPILFKLTIDRIHLKLKTLLHKQYIKRIEL